MKDEEGHILISSRAFIYDSKFGCLVIQFNDLTKEDWKHILEKAKELRNLEIRAFISDDETVTFAFITGELHGNGQHKLP